jgi:hypothetical protein
VKTALLFFKDDAPAGLGWRTPQKTVVVGNDLTALHLKIDQEPLGEGPVNADGSPNRA